MAIHAHRDDEDFEPPAGGIDDRTLLGGLGLGARAWLFFLGCVLAGAAFGGLYYYADRKLDASLQFMQQGARIDQLVNAVERGTYSLQARQRKFLLTRDTEIADGFSADLADVSTALDELFAVPDAQPLAQHITTIRDGLVQYDQQFQGFLNTEREIGLKGGTGLSAQMRQTSAALRAAFRETGNANLINQIERIDTQGEETVLSGAKSGVEEIQKRYRALEAFIKVAELTPANRARIEDLLRNHETQLLGMINARFELADEARRFEELFDYFVPSLTGLTSFSDRLRIESAADVRNMQLFTRYTILAGSMAILLWLMFWGLLLIKSLTSPAHRIAAAVERISRGQAHVTIPAQGNKDQFGRMARIIDGWADRMGEADGLRAELERMRDKLDSAVLDAETSSIREAEAVRRAEAAELEADDLRTARPQPVPQSYAEPADEPLQEAVPDPLAGLPEPDIATGPITSVSQQLQNFSQYVTAAANDVERTEALITGIDHMTALVDDIGELVMDIRDQTNSLAFRAPSREQGRGDDDNLIPFSEDGRGSEAERMYAKRFDHLRDATARTERTVVRIKETLAEVGDVARVIAETASHQALDATNKLLSQSEYLQNMLDDILVKVQPAKPGTLSERRPPKRAKDDPFA